MKLPITDEYLLRYLNSELDANEVAALKVQLSKGTELSQRLEELRVIQTYLKQTSKLETPRTNFTEVVIAGLDRVKTQSISAKRGLILLVGSIVASGIALGLISLGVFDSSTSLLIESPVQNRLLELPKINIPFNTKVLINGIIFLNLGLLFVLLDRTILKPLFQNRATAG
jgi:hypothetical protein